MACWRKTVPEWAVRLQNTGAIPGGWRMSPQGAIISLTRVTNTKPMLAGASTTEMQTQFYPTANHACILFFPVKKPEDLS